MMGNVGGIKDDYSIEHSRAKMVLEKIIEKIKDNKPHLIPLLNALKLKEREVDSISFDGEGIVYDPHNVMRLFKKESYSAVMDELLHVLIHILLKHPFEEKKSNPKVEWALMDMQVDRIIKGIKGEDVKATASRDSYYSIIKNKTKRRSITNNAINYTSDSHELWTEHSKEDGDSGDINGKYNKKLSRLVDFVMNELDSNNTSLMEFAKELTDSISKMEIAMWGNVAGDEEAEYKSKECERDYKDTIKDLIRQQNIEGEHPDNIDRNLYAYGMREYGILLIEEGEGECEERRVSTLAIAIDTSGSCAGPIADEFLSNIEQVLVDAKSYMGRDSEIIFLQADTEIREEVIYSFDDIGTGMFRAGKKLYGFGGTNFVPVFDRLKEYEVDALLFFSDGFGSFPAEEPDFKTIFCIPKEYKNHAFYEEAKLPGFVEKIYIE